MAESSGWPPVTSLGGRETETRNLAQAAAEGRCASLVGMSNVGKSFVLRALARTETGAGVSAFVYVDCNRMVEFTEQGFYELVLRCLRSSLDSLAAALQQHYDDVVNPVSAFLAHLRFSQGISAACEQAGRRIVFLLDEFDEVMAGIDDRVLLHLRALRDTYPERLSYVTASGRRLSSLRRSHGSLEFAELFAQDTHFLAPLADRAAAALAGQWAAEDGLALTPADLPTLLAETGGHPGLLSAACRALSALRQEAQAIGRAVSPAQVRERLDGDPACQQECARLWQELEQEERSALLQPPPPDTEAPAWRALAERYVVRRSEQGCGPFCQIFAAYLHRQRIARQPDLRGVRVDVETGDVWVDGQRLGPLTGLEYRLLLLLYGRLDKIVDKYTVVEAVWGQEYIDEVDDARIEKLVSRLRSKIESNPAEPRYLLTVRGRGYRLVGP